MFLYKADKKWIRRALQCVIMRNHKNKKKKTQKTIESWKYAQNVDGDRDDRFNFEIEDRLNDKNRCWRGGLGIPLKD